MSADLYEENLWGKIEYLHDRYHREHNHISNFLDMMTKYQNCCFEFSKQITNILNKNYILSESNTSSLYKSMEGFYKCLLMHSTAFKDTCESIKINIMPVAKSISDSFQKEKEMYNSYLKILTTHNNNKATLDKIKKEFIQKSKECEISVYNAKKAKLFSNTPPDQISKMEKKATELLTNTALFEDKYVQALKEANKSRENEIAFQKKLQSYYHNIDTDYYGKIKMMTGFFISCLKRMYNSISVEIESFNEVFNKINIENDINEFVEKNKTEAKPEDIIKYIPFKPAPEIESNSIVNSNPNDKKNLMVSYEVILVFQKLFRFIRTDLNMAEEKRKNRFRLLTLKIFSKEENESFTDSEMRDVLLYLKEKIYRSYILTILTKSRTKGFKKTEQLINDFIEILNCILEYSEKEKDFENALNCITIGQTFYYEKLNNYKNTSVKTYLIEGIKENKWLNTSEFWEGVINLMIQKEVEKSNDIKNNEKDKRNVFNQIVFTQLMNYSNSMLEFNINKNDISSLVEKISKKYQIKKEDCEAILNNINKTDKIEKIEVNKKLEKTIEKDEKLEKQDEKKNEIEDKKKEEKKGEKLEKKDEKKDEIIEDKKKEVKKGEKLEKKDENKDEIAEENKKEVKKGEKLEKKDENKDEIVEKNKKEEKKEEKHEKGDEKKDNGINKEKLKEENKIVEEEIEKEIINEKKEDNKNNKQKDDDNFKKEKENQVEINKDKKEENKINNENENKNKEKNKTKEEEIIEKEKEKDNTEEKEIDNEK